MKIFWLSSDDAPPGFSKTDFSYKGVRVRVWVRVRVRVIRREPNFLLYLRIAEPSLRVSTTPGGLRSGPPRVWAVGAECASVLRQPRAC